MQGFSVTSFLIIIFITLGAIASLIKMQISFPQELTSHIKISNSLYGVTSPQVHDPFVKSLNYTPLQNPYIAKTYQPPENHTLITISPSDDSLNQINQTQRSGQKNITFLLQDGVYTLNQTLNIKNDHIRIASLSGNPLDVIIQGSQHKNTGIGNLFRVTGKHFTIDGVTLQNAKNHLIQIAGESDADFPVIRNSILQDGFQQLMKVSYDKDSKPELSSDFGLIENNIFRYTEGIGPNYYIGGIDIHAGNSWIIRNNKFSNIASPGRYIAEHAIHIWNNASNNLVENNVIEDCDRGIGFGMLMGKLSPNVTYSNFGGIIRNNTIIHSDNGDSFSDTGIVLEDSASTLIEDNKIWLGHDYPRAIEYRYPSTKGVVIRGNITNKRISSRDGGEAEVYDNITDADLETILAEHLFSGD